MCCLSPSLTLYFYLVSQELNEYVNERKRQTDNRNFIIKLQEQITEMPLVHTAMSSPLTLHKLTGSLLSGSSVGDGDTLPNVHQARRADRCLGEAA